MTVTLTWENIAYIIVRLCQEYYGLNFIATHHYFEIKLHGHSEQIFDKNEKNVENLRSLHSVLIS